MKKRTIGICLSLVLLLLCGCSNSHDNGVKTVKVSNFTDLIFDKDVLLPNPDFAWGMTTDDFLSKVYGADTMDPDSENFDNYRYSHSEEANITTFSPPISYAIDGISDKADVGYAFDANGLYQSAYSWIFKSSETEKAAKTVEVLAADLNANPNIAANRFEMPDLSKDARDNPSFLYEYKWSLVNGAEQSIKLLVSGKIPNAIIVTLAIGK